MDNWMGGDCDYKIFGERRGRAYGVGANEVTEVWVLSSIVSGEGVV